MVLERVVGFMPSAPAAEAGFEMLPRMPGIAAPSAATTPTDPLLEQNDVLRAQLAAIANKDQAALGAFYDETISRVYGLALRITSRPDAAEEVASDVYLQVWRDAALYDTSRGRVLAWLLTICRSRAIDSLRRRDQAEPLADPDELPSGDGAFATDPQDLLDGVQTHSALHAALELLTPLQRQLLALAFFRGLTHDEIARHSQLPLGSVKTHVRKALGILKTHLTRSTLENRT